MAYTIQAGMLQIINQKLEILKEKIPVFVMNSKLIRHKVCFVALGELFNPPSENRIDNVSRPNKGNSFLTSSVL